MLRQIKVRYDPLEDRLQLSLLMDEHTHYLMLTRRVWVRARLGLQRLLDLSAETPAGLPRSTRDSLSAAHHQAVAAQTPAEREPAEAVGAPSGAALVAEIRVGERKAAAGAGARRAWVICFVLHQQPELRLVLNDKTLHALVSALLQREDTAQWALPALPARAPMAQVGKLTLQ
jgi:hypothetical protein